MDARGYQHYREQSLNTMTNEELLLILYDELVKRVHRCGMALEQKDYALLDASADRSIEILRYLDNTLNMNYPVSHQLHRLYEFFTYEMQRVKFGRNKEELEKIRPMITDLRDTFRVAERNAAQERASRDKSGGAK